MPQRTTIIATTATLLAGQETMELLERLGLTPGTSFQRLSNRRHDVQDIIRVLRHGLSGWSFPDLDWVVEGTRKMIIYCENYSICLRLRIYLAPHRIICIYNSLCLPSYNVTSPRLFIDDPSVQITIATDALVVGIDIPNVEDVIDLDCVKLSEL